MHEKRLFTPGPLSTSPSVKEAMLLDVGSRDSAFIGIVAEIRRQLLELAGSSSEQGYEAILVQGSGTFGIEAMINSALGPGDRLLVVTNGAYGRRLHSIAHRYDIPCEQLEFPENASPDPERVEAELRKGYSHLAIVHCETTTGVLNRLDALAEVAKRTGCSLLVDAMSSFGAVELDVHDCNIDYLVSSSNKCLQGVPGFSFVIARRAALTNATARPRSVCLDLAEQLAGFERDGQFRFTPPTHAILAFHRALAELEAEGGIAGRSARYQGNHECLVTGMRRLGFREYVPPDLQSPVLTTFLYPRDPRFDFQDFYERLSARGMVIYPGKLSDVDCFRIGSIGHLFAADMQALVEAIEASVREMDLPVPLP